MVGRGAASRMFANGKLPEREPARLADRDELDVRAPQLRASRAVDLVDERARDAPEVVAPGARVEVVRRREPQSVEDPRRQRIRGAQG